MHACVRATEYGNVCVKREKEELLPGDSYLAEATPKPLRASGYLHPGAGSIAPTSLTATPAAPRSPWEAVRF